MAAEIKQLKYHKILIFVPKNYFRVTELQSQKAKTLRQLREKEEESEIISSKLDQLRRDLRKSEKLKKSVIILFIVKSTCFFFFSKKDKEF